MLRELRARGVASCAQVGFDAFEGGAIAREALRAGRVREDESDRDDSRSSPGSSPSYFRGGAAEPSCSFDTDQCASGLAAPRNPRNTEANRTSEFSASQANAPFASGSASVGCGASSSGSHWSQSVPEPASTTGNTSCTHAPGMSISTDALAPRSESSIDAHGWSSCRKRRTHATRSRSSRVRPEGSNTRTRSDAPTKKLSNDAASGRACSLDSTSSRITTNRGATSEASADDDACSNPTLTATDTLLARELTENDARWGRNLTLRPQERVHPHQANPPQNAVDPVRLPRSR